MRLLQTRAGLWEAVFQDPSGIIAVKTTGDTHPGSSCVVRGLGLVEKWAAEVFSVACRAQSGLTQPVISHFIIKLGTLVVCSH